MNGALASSVATMDPASALRLAVCVCNVREAEHALARGADVNRRQEGLVGETALLTAVSKGDCAMVDTLLRWGADVHQTGTGSGDWQRILGVTPLMVAATQGHVDVVVRLLTAGARPGDLSSHAHDPRGAVSAAGLAHASGHAYLAALLKEFNIMRINQQFLEMKAELDCADALVQFSLAPFSLASIA